jgi:hypothetical protein
MQDGFDSCMSDQQLDVKIGPIWAGARRPNGPAMKDPV